MAVLDHNQISLKQLFCGPTSVLNGQQYRYLSRIRPSPSFGISKKKKNPNKKRKAGNRDKIAKRTCTRGSTSAFVIVFFHRYPRRNTLSALSKSLLRGDQIHVWEAFQVHDKHRNISAYLQLLSSANEGKAGKCWSCDYMGRHCTGKGIVLRKDQHILYDSCMVTTLVVCFHRVLV